MKRLKLIRKINQIFIWFVAISVIVLSLSEIFSFKLEYKYFLGGIFIGGIILTTIIKWNILKKGGETK